MVLTVARDAIVDTGEDQYVFVVTGPGQFEPRAVELGLRLHDRVEVRSGLGEGEEIVASGVFLIDSESRLRASGGAGTGHAHGAAEPPGATSNAPPTPDAAAATTVTKPGPTAASRSPDQSTSTPAKPASLHSGHQGAPP